MENKTVNTFYKNTSQKHLEKMIAERDYYHAQTLMLVSYDPKEKQGYRLMEDFYNALIAEAQKHIANHS